MLSILELVLGISICCLLLYKLIDRLVRWPRLGGHGDRYVLVTGCATGFGFQMVRRLETLGCHVFAGCRRPESVKKLKEIFSDRVHPILMDIANPDHVKESFRYISSVLPKDTGLWGLVNNAAAVEFLPLELTTVDTYRRYIEINLFGTVDVTLTFLPLLKKARGRIVNVSSLLGRITWPIALAYSTSKHGLEAFTNGLRLAMRRFRCKVVLVEPGAFSTNMLDLELHLKTFETAFKATVNEDHMLQRELQKMKKIYSNVYVSDRIDLVMDVYEHALFGRHPRGRYVVGLDAKLLLLVNLLPEWISDWVLCSYVPPHEMP